MAAMAKDVLIVKRIPIIGEEHTILEALRSVDFWILFVLVLCKVGIGFAMTTNIYMANSLEVKHNHHLEKHLMVERGEI
ncbi:hypothetical protein CR513_47756, partial [Mucuna pruriens]